MYKPVDKSTRTINMKFFLFCILAFLNFSFLPLSIADSTQEPLLDKNVYADNGDNKLAAERGVFMEDVSGYSHVFLSDVKTLPFFQIGDMTYRFDFDEPSDNDDMMNAARKRIGESPEVMEKAKKELIDLLKNDTELNVPLEKDAWLIRFLRLKNYNPQKTHKLIRGYYKFKAKNEFIYKNLLPSQEKHVVKQKMFGLLPKRDQLGRRIFLFRVANWSPKIIPFLDVWRLSIILAEIGSYEPVTQIVGAQIIFDMKGLTWEHIRQFDPATSHKMVSWFLRPPLKFEGIHFVNQSYSFSILFSFFRPFMTEDLKNKIHFHGNHMKSLHQHISPSSLPHVYGGIYDKIDLSSYQWSVLLKSLDGEYAMLNSYGYKNKNGIKKET